MPIQINNYPLLFSRETDNRVDYCLVRIKTLWNRIVTSFHLKKWLLTDAQISRHLIAQITPSNILQSTNSQLEMVKDVISLLATRNHKYRSQYCRTDQKITLIVHKIKKLQALYRMHNARSRFIQKKAQNNAASTIQAVFRGFMVRSHLKREAAALKIQTYFRGFSA